MLKYIMPAALFAMLPMSAALADRDHYDRGHREYYHDQHFHRPRTVVSFNFGRAYYPYPYYPATRVVYAPQPVAVQPEVVYINNNNSRVVDNGDGRYCREYQSVVHIGGAARQTYGTACMEPDGTWEIQN